MPAVRSPVIGCPNGAGKTTFAREFLPSRVKDFLNADLIAAGLSPLDPAAAGLQAGRLLLARWSELFAARKSFAVESTLSGRTYINRLLDAREAGYTPSHWFTSGFPARIFPAAVWGSVSVTAGTTFRHPMCNGGTCRACGTFSSFTCPSLTIRFFWRLPNSRRNLWPDGEEHLSGY